jgi:hypothetical protein
MLALCVLGSAVVLAYIAFMLRVYLPTYLHEFRLGALSWQTVHDLGWAGLSVPVVGKDVGMLVLAIAAFRIGGVQLGMAALAGALTYLALPDLFNAAAITAILLVASALIARAKHDTRGQGWSGFAAVLLVAAPILWEPAGRWVGVLWAVCIGAVSWFSLTSGSGRSDYKRTMPLKRHVSAWVAVITVLSFLAAALGALHVPPAPYYVERFSPQVRDIWQAVRERTPSNALIFTQTGPDISRLSGWNDYSLSAQRQFYISTWGAGPFRIDSAAREERLAANEAVLSGKLLPSSLPLQNSYSDYYAVMVNQRMPPAYFELRYRNKAYSLYRITDKGI